jgi:hypothetical protein
MPTRSDLEALIADDLSRNDLSSQITRSVDTAIRAYRTTRFSFNEFYRFTATLTAGEARLVYTFPSGAIGELPFRKIDRIRLVRSTNDYLDLYHRDYNWIMSRQDIVTTSQPAEYCFYGDRVRFDSYADQTYTMLIDGVRDLAYSSDYLNETPGTGTSLSYSMGSTAAWFDEARELIRHRAKRELYAHVIKDLELATLAKGSEDDALDTLKGDINELVTTGFVRPSEF